MRLLRFVLPACLVAATCVALLGLFRVVGRTSTQPASDQTASLSLGSGSGPTVALPTRAPAPTPSPTASTLAPTPEPSPAPRLTAPVAVFNASRISGLAGRTATALRLRGVSVTSVANLSGALGPAATAVYYPPGILSQAQALAHMVGATDVEPAPAALTTAGTLVLVLSDPQSTALTAAAAPTTHGR